MIVNKYFSFFFFFILPYFSWVRRSGQPEGDVSIFISCKKVEEVWILKTGFVIKEHFSSYILQDVMNSHSSLEYLFCNELNIISLLTSMFSYPLSYICSTMFWDLVRLIQFLQDYVYLSQRSRKSRLASFFHCLYFQNTKQRAMIARTQSKDESWMDINLRIDRQPKDWNSET